MSETAASEDRKCFRAEFRGIKGTEFETLSAREIGHCIIQRRAPDFIHCWNGVVITADRFVGLAKSGNLPIPPEESEVLAEVRAPASPAIGVADLKAMLKESQGANAELSEGEGALTKARGEIEEARQRASLTNRAAMAALATAFAIMEIAPDRIEAAKLALVEINERLAIGARQFASLVVSAKIRELFAKALEEAERELRLHFSDDGALRLAALASSRVTELQNLLERATARSFSPDDAPQFAQDLIALWGEVSEFERKANWGGDRARKN